MILPTTEFYRAPVVDDNLIIIFNFEFTQTT